MPDTQGASMASNPQFASGILDALSAQRNNALNDNARLLAMNAVLRQQLADASDTIARLTAAAQPQPVQS